MATTAASTDHFLASPRRNVIWIPMDLYRKYTESSSSSSSSPDLSSSSCNWHTGSSSKAKRSHVLPKSRDSLHGRQSSSRIPSTLVQSKVLKTRSSKQRSTLYSPSHPLPSVKEQLSLPIASPYPTPSPESQTGATTSVTLLTTAFSSHSPPHDLTSTPTPTITGLSNVSNSCSSPPRKRVVSRSQRVSTACKRAKQSSNAQPDSHRSSLVPPKKRKRDHDVSQTNTPPKSQSSSPKHHFDKSQEHKRLKLSMSETAMTPANQRVSSARAMCQPEVIIISDDEADDVVLIVSDDDDNGDDGYCAVNSTAEVALPSPHHSVSSPSSLSTLSSETHTSVHQSLTPPVSTAASPVKPSSSVSTNYKYELDRHSRHLVETIFPPHEEATSKAVLERALATCRKLREEFIIDRFLGSGCSGFVLAAKRVQDGKNVAIKVIPHTADLVETKVQRELDILVSLKSHENVLEFVDYFTSSLYGDVDPDDRSNTDISYIVTELGGNSLFDFIELHKPADQEPTADDQVKYYPQGSGIQTGVIRSIFTQLSLALHSLHSQNIVHGDIKDENALITMDSLTNTYRAKLCDFGHSKHVGDGSSPSFAFYGTTILAPPEMDANIARREKERARKQGDHSTTHKGRRGAPTSSSVTRWEHFYGYEADVWAMGLLLFTMVHGDLPAELRETDAKRKAAYQRRRRSARSFPFTLEKNMDSDLKDLLKKILTVDPSRRLTISQVLAHPWMTKDE